MDLAKLRRMEADISDLIWEGDGGRDDFEEPWYWSSDEFREASGDYEEPWDDIRRRERMAEAMYEC